MSIQISKNNQNICKAEILAPAGNFDCVVAAARCGADAVYLGAKSFSARAGAQNFDDEELLKTVEYCHERGISVHLALNTALYDAEMKEAARIIENAAKIGVDALIVSDLGVLSLAKNICPSLPLHASTQMGVASVSGVNAVKELGFTRAVLAREMSREEILEVTSQNIIETEVFVHGALCMCVSGQCYMSAVLGKRSGNRGRCAQPCRLPFSLSTNSKEEYALSLKDSSLCKYIPELCKMGVTSFKIEGRMKRPEYVAAAVSLVKASMHGEDYDEILSLSRDIFSRSGFTDGYFKSDINKSMFGFRSYDDVSRAKEAIPALHSLYRRDRQSVAVSATLRLEAEKPAELSFSDFENSVTAYGDHCKIGKGLNRDFVFDKISRLGQTPYYIENLDVISDSGAEISPSALNNLRREAAQLLSQKRKTPPDREIFEVKPLEDCLSEKNAQKVIARFENYEQLKGNIELCDAAFLPIRECLKLLNSGDDKLFKKIIPELDRFAFANDGFTKKALEILKQNSVNRVCIQNIGQLYLAKQVGMEITFGAFMNVYNSHALDLLKKNGVESAFASFEVSSKKISNLKPFVSLGALVYGHIPLMITRACPQKSGSGCKNCDKSKTLTDRTGKKFKIVCRGEVSEILNPIPLSAQIENADFDSLDFLTPYFTCESNERCKEVILAVKNRISPHCEGDFSRGMYKNGVI